MTPATSLVSPQPKAAVFPSWQEVLFLAVTGLAVCVTLGHHALLGGEGLTNHYIFQADAFIHGRLDLLSNVGGDISLFEGRYYLPVPPLPAVLLAPFVVLFGPENTNAVVIALGLTLLSLGYLAGILRRFGLAGRDLCYATMAFYLGTGYWAAVIVSHGHHHFAQVVAVTAILGAFAECFNKQRPFVVMLFWGAAFLSRQCMVFSWVFLAAVLAFNLDRTLKQRTWNFLAFACFSAFPVAIYLLYNYARFQDPFETGYSIIVMENNLLKERVLAYGLFSYHYIVYNFLYMFVQGFNFEFSGATFLSHPSISIFGTSLTFASPFLFFAFYAHWNRAYLLGAWVSVILCLVVQLTYYSNGWSQLNTQRYALDFVPIVFLMFIRALPYIQRSIWIGAVVYSVCMNIIALFLLPILGRLV